MDVSLGLLKMTRKNISGCKDVIYKKHAENSMDRKNNKRDCVTHVEQIRSSMKCLSMRQLKFFGYILKAREMERDSLLS